MPGSDDSEHDTQADHGQREHDQHGQHGMTGWVMQLPQYGAVILVLFMAFTLYVIASRAIGVGPPSDQANRVHWNLKNATRVGGGTDAETGAAALAIAYPSTRAENSPALTVRAPNDWRNALAATPLIARPSNAVVLVDGASADSPSATASDKGPPVTGDAPTVAAGVDTWLAARNGMASQVIIVAADGDAHWALPAAPYASRTGTPILYVTRRTVPAQTADALTRRRRRATMFLLGPASVIPDSVADILRRYGRVVRIAGGTPELNAIRFAEFRDNATGFGWGRTGRGQTRWTPATTMLVSPARWQDAIAAAHLARTGKSGPLLFTGSGRLPAVVDAFLWRQRPTFANTPAEGPFNHVWVVGSFDRIPYMAEAWADYSQEIEQYMTLGDSALSGFEALALAWVFFAVATSIWILVHSGRRIPEMMPMMRTAWALFALLLGPIALWLYASSYNRREKMANDDGMVTWHRPPWAQAVSATVMMFAFDMMLMVLAVFLLAYAGFPIIRSDAPFYIFGSAMFLMMVLMYVVALIVMMLVFHTPMTMHERRIKSFSKAFATGFPLMLATMTVESLGMMPTMWWAQMSFLPGMQMPTTDDFTMWATLLMATVVGLLVVLPFNYRMVRSGRKMGSM